MARLHVATIGSSGIAQRFLEALEAYDGAELVAVYSRDLDRAREIAQAHGAPHAVDDLDELAALDDVDAVYIASPNSLHARQAWKFVAAGKHVLVEKPFATCEREAASLFKLAESKGVVAMEAMRPIHTPGFAKVAETLPELGEVRLGYLGFSKVTSRIKRLRAGERMNVFDPVYAGGALMDIGVYCVEPAMALFGRPLSIESAGVTMQVPGSEPGSPYALIDLSGSVLLGYSDKVITLSYGKVSDDLAPCQIQGETATLLFDNVNAPTNLRVMVHKDQGMTWGTVGGDMHEVAVENPENDMVCELDDFCRLVNGDVDGARRYAKITLDSLAVMDAIRAQVGVRFPSDES